jgi:hypothetical protein
VIRFGRRLVAHGALVFSLGLLMADKQDRKRRERRDSSTVNVEARPDEDEARSLARKALEPAVRGAVTTKEYSNYLGDLDLVGLIAALEEQTKAVIDSDLGRIEAILTTQAHTLDAIFHNLARRAIRADYMDKLDRYLRIGLKAQNQCRATLQALAEMKNPKPVAFVQQANIAAGDQQVNNGVEPSRARKLESEQSKLLEANDGERLDTGEAGAATEANSALEAVGAIDRAKNTRG